MKRNLVLASFLLAVALFSPTAVLAGSMNCVYIGAEDRPILGDRDFNDEISKVCGYNLTLHSPNGTAMWNPFGPPPNLDGVPGWDNGSTDGGSGGHNAGFFMTGTGHWTNNPVSPHLSENVLQDWTTSNGSLGSFYLTADGTVTFRMLVDDLSVAAYEPYNVFGYDYTSDPSKRYVLFPGGSNGGDSASFTPTGGAFNLFLKSPDGLFGSKTGVEPFSVFREVGISPPPTPESGTMALMGGGLLCLVGIIRRRRQ